MAGFRAGASALILCLAAAPAAALDTLRCADAKGEAAVEIDITFADDRRTAGDVSRVLGRFADFDISTGPRQDGAPPERLFEQVSEDDRLEVYVSDPDDVRIVLALRVFRDFMYDGTDREYDEHVVAGTLRAMGAGVWAVTCTGW